MKKLIFLFFLFSISITCYAVPQEIIIIRHADKLMQENPGPALSSKGYIRAVNFAFYFLKMFYEPDFMIASDPIQESIDDYSIRELQTLAPLANIIAEKYPNQEFPILHPYASSDYQKLAYDLMNQKKFNDKRILICWSHSKIPDLAKELGVKDKIEKWPKSNFDSIFILKYNKNGTVAKFEIWNNQYDAVDFSWEEIKNHLT